MAHIKKILNKIKRDLDPLEIKRFIEPLEYNEELSRDDLIHFHAPNIYIAKWVKTNYTKSIIHLFENETGLKPKIEISINRDGEISSVETYKPSSRVTTSINLNPSFTFDTFIVGESNQFAYTIARSVADKPGKQYNPLFLYGNAGLGKSHLLEAIGNYRVQYGDKVIYTTLEQFMNKYIAHTKAQTMDDFRDYYRQCDFLLIDDIQFLSQKEQTQEEFFHTFNELHTAGKQIVITADRPPKEIPGLAERLKTRFEWGLMAQIQPPELDTKIAIIQKKCEIDGISLPKEIIYYLATHMGDNIREIEGAIIKLNAMSNMLNKTMDLEFAQSAIKEQLKEKQENITIDDIVKVVARELNVKPSDIKSKKRTRVAVNARRIAIYLTRELTSISMPQIAIYFGMKDHTTISHAMKKIKEQKANDEYFAISLEELSNKVGYGI